MGDWSWNKKRNFLAFTLNGNTDNVTTITEILRSAPSLPNWEFIAGRPRRECNHRLVFHNERGQQIDINLQDWRYVLTEFENGQFFDVAVATNQQLRMDERAQQQVLNTAVQAALGELVALRHIDRVEFVGDPDDEWEERATPFIYLAEHIDKLTQHLTP